jgi:small-conductance mechanosensitive channel
MLKFLGRPVVQVQIAVGICALGGAWLPARAIIRALDRRYAALVERARPKVVAGSHGESDQAPNADAELDRRVRSRLGAVRPVYAVVRQIVAPLVALVFVLVAGRLLATVTWYSGLLNGLADLLGLFLIYRLLLGSLAAFVLPEKAVRYRWQLLAPFFGLLGVALVLGAVIDLRALLQASLIPRLDEVLTLGDFLLATVGFYFWIACLSLGKDVAQTLLSRRPGANAGVVDASLTLLQYALIVAGAFAVLRLLQFDPITVAAITGGLSLGIGFASQDVFKNFIGGLIVVFEGSVRPGDLVEIAGTEGEVDRLSVRSTVVRTFDNVEYIVPNQEWLGSTVKVLTHTSRRLRVRVPVGVSYDADPHRVQALLSETARRHPDVLPDPAPVASLVAFGASSLDFILFAWVGEAKFQGRVANELRLMLYDVLTANDIRIPYPQHDVYIRSATTVAPP